MLEEPHSTRITELLDKLPCKIELPAEWSNFFNVEGLLPSRENDYRQRPRKHFRERAILQLSPSLPAVIRQNLIHVVYTQNISHSGMAFLHVEQLFPGETGRLWLVEQRFSIEVVRCNRINSQCYSVGACLVAE